MGLIHFLRRNNEKQVRSIRGISRGGECSLWIEVKGWETAVQRIDLLKETNYQLSVSLKVDYLSEGAVIFDTEDRFYDASQFVFQSGLEDGWV